MCQHGGLTNKTNKSIVKNKNNILGKTHKKISGFFSGQTTKRGGCSWTTKKKPFTFQRHIISGSTT